MAENALYEALDNYNSTIENKYKKNWGSLLDFLGKHLPPLNLLQKLMILISSLQSWPNST